MNTIRERLNKEHDCLSSFEFTLTLPMSMLIIFMVSFVFLLLISWINYNALAGDIARDLNFRQTGIKVAETYWKNHGTGSVILSGKDSADATNQVTWDSISVNGHKKNSGSKYAQCIAWSMLQHPNKFFMVYSMYDSVDVSVRRTNADGSGTFVDDNFDQRMSNHIVQVDIKWNFFPISGWGTHWDGVEMHSAGYSVIT